MNKTLAPREGVTLFVAGRTPDWGSLEFRLDNKVVEGIKQVDVSTGWAQVYARDAFGNWPAFDSRGWPIFYEVRGNWTVHEVYPPDTEFDDPDYVRRKQESRDRKKAGDHAAGIS